MSRRALHFELLRYAVSFLHEQDLCRVEYYDE